MREEKSVNAFAYFTEMYDEIENTIHTILENVNRIHVSCDDRLIMGTIYVSRLRPIYFEYNRKSDVMDLHPLLI